MTGAARARVVLGGFVAGLAGGLFGVGGGILLVPLLTGSFGLTQHQAHGTSLAAIGATAIAGLVVYAAHGQVAWGTAALMAVTSLLTARLGARLAARTAKRHLARAFAVFLLLVAVRLLWRAPSGEGAAITGGLAIASELVLGAAVGLLAGFMGVGGGILAVPALTLLFGFSQQMAQGTSLALILVAAPVGAIEHHRHGNVALALLPLLAIGSAVGAPLASQLAQHLPQAALARGFALFLAASAVQVWLRASREAPPASTR